MAYSTAFRHEVTGLKEFVKFLSALGVPDAVIKDAMNASGLSMADEMVKLAPRDTGAMASSVKVNKAKNLLRVTVGNNTTVKQAYPFHAIELGKSRGGLTFRVNARGSRAAYTRVARVRDYPFALIAAKAKQAQVLQDWLNAFKKIVAANPPGRV